MKLRLAVSIAFFAATLFAPFYANAQAAPEKNKIICDHAAPPRGMHYVCKSQCDCHLEGKLKKDEDGIAPAAPERGNWTSGAAGTHPISKGPSSHTPRLVVNVAHCLATERQNWLNVPNSGSSARFGYLVDKQSFPGKTYIYVVTHFAGDNSVGLLFDVESTSNGQIQVFKIVNNAKFKISGGTIDFMEPPLGGEWTQRHLISAIQKIEGKSLYTLTVDAMRLPNPKIECTSYASGGDLNSGTDRK